jgi:hypothetical protein
LRRWLRFVTRRAASAMRAASARSAPAPEGVRPGASLKELMARLGHSSTRAAMIYQHATRDRDQAIARALGGLVQQLRTATVMPDEGTADA